MSRARVVFSGQTYGKLTVIQQKPSRKGYRQWLCCCSCGETCIQSTNYLRSTKEPSCGCLLRQAAAERTRTGFKVMEWDSTGRERVVASFGIYEKRAASMLVRLSPPQLKRRIESVYEEETS